MKNARRFFVLFILFAFVGGFFAPVVFSCAGPDCSCCKKACQCKPGICLYNYQLQVSVTKERSMLPVPSACRYSSREQSHIYAFDPIKDIFHPPRAA